MNDEYNQAHYVKKNWLWYLATPYRAHPDGTDTAYTYARHMTNFLMDKGWKVFSPIVYSHYLEKDVERDEEYWLTEVDAELLRRCNGMIIVKMAGWNKSRGILFERGFCMGEGKAIITTEYMEEPIIPDELPRW